MTPIIVSIINLVHWENKYDQPCVIANKLARCTSLTYTADIAAAILPKLNKNVAGGSLGTGTVLNRKLGNITRDLTLKNN